MARLLKKIEPEVTQYRDRQFNGTQEQFEECLRTSTTVYVGNLSFFTTEEQIYEVFTKVGDVMRIVMGLDKGRKTPCGFCFVVYYTRQDAELCLSYLNGTTVDDRPIRVDVDWGFVEGRQYGRGRSGGQVRDEYRTDYDEGRGGFGHVMSDKMTLPPGMPMMAGTPPGGPPPRPTGKRKLSADEPVRNPRFRQERADEPPADD